MKIKRGSGTKRAAIYLRKSTQQQKQSIESQRQECRRYAAEHGYEISGEYIDSGITGVDSKSKRKGFSQLVQDAESGQFEFVITYELSRASRSKPRHFIVEMSPLADAGIRFCFTDKAQPMDLDNFADYLQASIESHAANDYVLRVARGTTRGQRDKAKTGRWVAGRPPIGLIVDAEHRLQLGKPADVELIRSIFRWYEAGKSYRGIVEELQSQGIRRGVSFVSQALKNRLYVGDFVWNRNTQARFYSARGDKLATDFETGKTDEDDQVIVENNHPAIIDRETFDRVQAMFDSRRRKSTPTRNGGAFILTGLCRCKACGSNLVGFTSNGQPWLRCGGHAQHGLAKCHNNLVSQKQLIDAIIDSLEQEFLDEARIEAVREAYLSRLESDRESFDADELQTRLTAAQAAYKDARRKLTSMPADLMDDFADDLREMKADVERIGKSLEAAQVNSDAQAAGFDDDVAEFCEMVRELKSAVHDADPATVRAFLSSVIEKVVVDVSHREAGSRFRYTLEGGEILLNPGLSLCAAW